MSELSMIADGVLRARGPAGATPLVCLPGLLGDARVFQPLAEVVAPTRGLLAFDLPPGSPAEAAGVLEGRLRDHLKGPADLLTGSFGGLVARCLDPALLRSWATVATTPGRDLIPRGVALQRRLLSRLPSAVVEAAYAHHLRRALALDGVPPELAARMEGRALDKATLMGRLGGVLAWEVGPLPQRPTLWILGATDPLAPWSVAEVLERCPDAEVTHVPGGHRPYASHPAPLAARLRTFHGGPGG